MPRKVFLFLLTTLALAFTISLEYYVKEGWDTMNIMDIIGPVMIGPSSSHTAGAVRLGLMAKSILGAEVKQADIFLHGSFAETYKGHGTDMALLAGLMGWATDDERIPEAKAYAQVQGLSFKFSKIDLGSLTHPNTVLFKLTGNDGNMVEVTGSSVGGGQILVTNIDGMDVEVSGKFPALITTHIDKPGVINMISGILAYNHINIATMRLFRDEESGVASLLIECDQEVPPPIITMVENLDGICSVRSIRKLL